MKSLFRIALVTCAVMSFFAESSARADGCYTCGSGSQPQCRDYCRYAGSDTFGARNQCEKRGCKVSGTASCPTDSTVKVCMAPVEDSTKTVATVLQCTTQRG